MDRTQLQQLIATLAPRLRQAWSTAWAHVSAENTEARIVARMHLGPDRLLIDADAAVAAFGAAERDAYVTAGRAAAHSLGPQLPSVAKKLVTFDDADAVRWTRRILQDLSHEQRELVRAALIDAARRGENPIVTARRIREAIGLTPMQERAVRNYRAQLEAGQYAAALDRELTHGASDRTVAAALRRDTSLTGTQIDTAVDRYRQNWLRYRAETLARTESLRLAHEGSDALYRQTVGRGDLAASDLLCEWLATHDPRTRDTHAAMDHQVRPWGEPFESPSGALLRYPGDPDAPPAEIVNCRCVKSTRLRAPTAAAA